MHVCGMRSMHRGSASSGRHRIAANKLQEMDGI
eukprot:SAG31_NODE_19315_length_606_cov_1.015779_1_plen_32_part_10